MRPPKKVKELEEEFNRVKRTWARDGRKTDANSKRLLEIHEELDKLGWHLASRGDDWGPHFTPGKLVHVRGGV